MLQSVSISVLEPPAANPRKKFDRKAIEGLASSIKQDGILHNLVVTPTGSGRKQRYQIVSGARRLEALKLLQERGELPEDFTVAVEGQQGRARIAASTLDRRNFRSRWNEIWNSTAHAGEVTSPRGKAL
jgi:ParB/RepB/Spo0J family partition protein